MMIKSVKKNVFVLFQNSTNSLKYEARNRANLYDA